MKKTRAPYNNNGEFKDFNAVDGTLGTVLSAEDQNAHQDEICNAIDATGQEQNYNDNQQLAKAIGIQSTISNLFLDTGTANNYILNRPANFIEPFELRENIVISFIPQNANTGASTINFCGLGTYPIKNLSDADVEAGDIVADSLNYLLFSANAFKIITFSAPTMPADSAENKIASTKFVQNVLLSVALEFLKYFKILPDGSLILEKQKDPTCVDPYFVVMSTSDLANISGMANNDIVVVANAGNNAATYKYDGNNWGKLKNIVLDTGFLFACKKDNHGYYWFGNEWNILDFSFNPDEFGKLADNNTWTGHNYFSDNMEIKDMYNRDIGILVKTKTDLETGALWQNGIAIYNREGRQMGRLQGFESADKSNWNIVLGCDNGTSEHYFGMDMDGNIIKDGGNFADYVITNYRNGANWYRKWKSGFIEQGGQASGSGQQYTVTLIVPFSNTNYQVLVTSRTAGTAVNNNAAVVSVTTTNFSWNSMLGNISNYMVWYACGN